MNSSLATRPSPPHHLGLVLRRSPPYSSVCFLGVLPSSHHLWSFLSYASSMGTLHTRKSDPAGSAATLLGPLPPQLSSSPAVLSPKCDSTPTSSPTSSQRPISQGSRDFASNLPSFRDFSGDPLIKTLPSNVGGMGSNLGQGTKVSHALGPEN